MAMPGFGKMASCSASAIFRRHRSGAKAARSNPRTSKLFSPSSANILAESCSRFALQSARIRSARTINPHIARRACLALKALLIFSLGQRPRIPVTVRRALKARLITDSRPTRLNRAFSAWMCEIIFLGRCPRLRMTSRRQRQTRLRLLATASSFDGEQGDGYSANAE